MLPAQNGWDKFVKRIPVKASVQTVYDSWATSTAIEQWFLRSAEYSAPGGTERSPDEPVQAGDSYSWRWHGYGDEVNEKGTILQANGIDVFSFTFAGQCTVTFRAFEESGETIAELTQENIPADDNAATNLLVGCGEGWVFYLANLKSIVEGGIDLRNKNINLKKVISS